VTSAAVITASSAPVTPTTGGAAVTSLPGIAETTAPATPAAVTTIASRVVTSPSENVRKGDTGPGVEQIQTALRAAGYDLKADGVFGDVTDRAVRDYQEENGLTVDGVVGPNTWAKLGSAGEATTTTTG
jgi:peptidoglycan hydrolase-like protein with peptidoglycan-binding domain